MADTILAQAFLPHGLPEESFNIKGTGRGANRRNERSVRKG